MKKLICILLSVTAMTLHVQAKNNPAGENAAAGTPVVIEIGSRTLKAGLSTSAVPTVTISHNFTTGGAITNWTAFENALNQVFSQLGVNPANHPVLISERPLNPKAAREKTAEILFNKFNAPSIYIAVDAVLALYVTGNVTGTVAHSHGDVTWLTSVYNGYALPHAAIRLDIGSNELAAYMKDLLNNKGYNVNDQDAAAITQNLGYVAFNQGESHLNYELELGKSPAGIAQSYQLTGGQTISVDQERFKAPEALFQPALIGMASAGIHEVMYNSIMKCQSGIRKDLYANMVIAGSNTLFPNIKERLKEEISVLAPPTTNMIFKTPANREYLPWTGGKMLAPVITSNNMWLSKATFDAEGSSGIHKYFSL